MAEIPSDKLYLFKTEVEEIKGISSQSVDDLVNAATELKRNFQAYTFFTETVSVFTINSSSSISEYVATSFDFS